MIKSIFALFILTGINSLALDPVQDYLSRHTFPTRNSKFDGQLFADASWTGDNHHQPSGGYLLRFDAPIGPNGSSVTFVASSLLAYLRGSNWFAYQNTGNGATLLSGQVSFGYLNFYLAPATSKHGPVLCEIISDKTDFYVGGICIDNSGHLVPINLIGEPRDQDLEDTDPSYEQNIGNELIKNNQLIPFEPKLEKILLAEYLKTPSIPWRLAKDKTVRGLGTDPDEKGHLTAAQNFRKEDAAQLWKTEMPVSSQPNK